MIYTILITLSLILLLIASIEDIKTRKVSNIYYIIILSVSIIGKLIYYMFLDRLDLITLLIISIGAFYVILEILFNFKILGGGDCKIIFALSSVVGFDFNNIFILVYLIFLLILGLPYYYYWRAKGRKDSPPFIPYIFILLFLAYLHI